MKITIIGAGSIGGAIARGLAKEICLKHRTSPVRHSRKPHWTK